MQQVKKVEIIISTLEMEEVLDILDTVRVSGYTAIKNTSGKGERGISYNDLGATFSNSYIMTVCTNDKQLNDLIDELLPLLKKIGGICLVSDANWVIH
ncbi:P-II family nitrogen regulator [Gloeothece verrucosa]|uniref:Nitrogen regulatory protein P-II n=1 Tax=Gloeothece verrucosa (strain PCC 7822) TaxID=497965 RepID=E0UHC1_GLOV7|nr:nitrogen regulatory protein P-II [Gloeothece verrucosa]ADN16835.1 nitrogen regulatory protein P-II [Gloeothece verrucosa PCC 7822]